MVLIVSTHIFTGHIRKGDMLCYFLFVESCWLRKKLAYKKRKEGVIMKKGIVLLTLLALMLSLVPVGYSETGPVTITYAFWGNNDQVPIRLAVIDRFMEENPDIKVECQYYTWDVINGKYVAQAAAGTLPDVMVVAGDWYEQFADKYLLGLSEFLGSADELTSIPESLFKVFDQDGKVCAVPFQCASTALYYNKNIFDEAGIAYPDTTWTWDTFYEVAIQLTKGEGKDRIIGVESIPWATVITSYGGNLFNEERTEITLDDERVLKAFTQYQNLALNHNGIATSADQDSWAGMPAFASGRIAMNLRDFYAIGGYQVIEDFDWDVTLVPAQPDGIRTNIVYVNGHAISSTSKHPEEAWRLVSYLSQPDAQAEIMREEGFTPRQDMDLSSYLSEMYAKPENINIFSEALSYGIISPASSGVKQFSDIFFANYDLMMEGKLAPKEAIAKMVEDMEIIID